MKNQIIWAIGIVAFTGYPGCVEAGQPAPSAKVAASASSTEGAKAFIQDLGARAIKSLTQPGIAQAQLESNFQALLEEGFDVRDIAHFVMGSNWKHMNADQQNRFIPLFEKRLKKTYSMRFQQYQGVEFKVISARQEGDHVVVHTTIQKPGGPLTPVDWNIKGGKVHDVRIEGVSMTITIRDEYKELFKQGQVEQFLTALNGGASA